MRADLCRFGFVLVLVLRPRPRTEGGLLSPLTNRNVSCPLFPGSFLFRVVSRISRGKKFGTLGHFLKRPNLAQQPLASVILGRSSDSRPKPISLPSLDLDLTLALALAPPFS